MVKFQSLAVIEDKPVDWALKPLTAKGEMLYIVGHGGNGKSTLIADICGAAADHRYKSGLTEELLKHVNSVQPNPWPGGLCAGGCLEVSPDMSPVLIVDGENTARTWRKLMAKTFATYGINPQSQYALNLLEDINHVRSSEYYMDDSKNRKERMFTLYQDAAVMGIKTIILDPIWKIFSPGGPGDSEWVTNGISYLRDLTIEAGINTICVAHPAADSKDRTGDRVFQPFGSSQQHGMYDSLVYIKRENGHAKLTLSKTRAQDWIQPKSKVRLEYGPRGGGFLDTRDPWPLVEPEDGIYLSDPSYSLLQLLPSGLFRVDQVAQMTDKTVKKYLSAELIPAGCVEHVSGEGKKGDPALYKITEIGMNHLRYKKSLAASSSGD